MIATLLNHSTPLTAEKYYNHARAIDAGRASQANIRGLRAEALEARRLRKRKRA